MPETSARFVLGIIVPIPLHIAWAAAPFVGKTTF
jgi:hypothetical protein